MFESKPATAEHLRPHPLGSDSRGNYKAGSIAAEEYAGCLQQYGLPLDGQHVGCRRFVVP